MLLEKKTHVKNSVARLVFVLAAMVAQVTWFVIVMTTLKNHSTIVSLLIRVLSVLLVLRIYGKNENAAFKMPWILLLLIFPVLGVCLYSMFGNKRGMGKIHRRFQVVSSEIRGMLQQQPEVMEELERQNLAMANQCRYIGRFGAYPLYCNTDIRFYAEAIGSLEAQIEDLKNAQRFIFMEYHAIQEAEMFSRLKPILAERAASGVEIRILYDDVGSVGFIDPGFIDRMEEIGVQCRRFNPLLPVLNIFMNNRDHRKITVIDGKVGYTGGYNLADEYFNITHPYGEWKDTGIRMEGDAVKSLTAIFLEMWNAMEKTDTEPDISGYLETDTYEAAEDGFVQSYADTPLDDETLGENIYMNLIKNAKRSLYVTTPYLILTDEMSRELRLAAQRGVDVRIVTPGIPDKKMVYRVTRSYYATLADGGVRIYEYTPGFLHAKQVLCDGEAGTVGTVNFDYRSLYHHFENGVLFYRYHALTDVSSDFENLFRSSREVTEQYRNRSAFQRIAQSVLRLFAPLM